MEPSTFCELAQRLMRCPAVPYFEIGVRAEAERICIDYGLPYGRDYYGNLLVRLPSPARVRPLVLAAHLDHPGFEIIGPLAENRWRARFLGSVPADHFRPGIPVRMLPGGIKGVCGERADSNSAMEFELHANSPAVLPPRMAVWDLEDFAVRRGRIHGRACDDLIGCAAVLATLIELKAARTPANVIGVLSRAEEVGFHGALTVAVSRRLPKDALLVSLETSREIPPIKMGGGVIVRVGDKTSIFDSMATRFLSEVAGELTSRVPRFQFQRALMSGGTCEGTAYQEFGFQTAALCVALGNYHNCAPGKTIAAEYVDITDACGMVDLLVEAAKRSKEYSRLVSHLPKRLRRQATEARAAFRQRAAHNE